MIAANAADCGFEVTGVHDSNIAMLRQIAAGLQGPLIKPEAGFLRAMPREESPLGLDERRVAMPYPSRPNSPASARLTVADTPGRF